MRRPTQILFIAYSLAAYAGFLAVFAYAVGFVQRVGVPKDIDDGASAATATAIAIDLVLLGLSSPLSPEPPCTPCRGWAG